MLANKSSSTRIISQSNKETGLKEESPGLEGFPPRLMRYSRVASKGGFPVSLDCHRPVCPNLNILCVPFLSHLGVSQ